MELRMNFCFTKYLSWNFTAYFSLQLLCRAVYFGAILPNVVATKNIKYHINCWWNWPMIYQASYFKVTMIDWEKLKLFCLHGLRLNGLTGQLKAAQKAFHFTHKTEWCIIFQKMHAPCFTCWCRMAPRHPA